MGRWVGVLAALTVAAGAVELGNETQVTCGVPTELWLGPGCYVRAASLPATTVDRWDGAEWRSFSGTVDVATRDVSTTATTETTLGVVLIRHVVGCAPHGTVYGVCRDPATSLCGSVLGPGPVWTRSESTEPYDLFASAPTGIASVTFADGGGVVVERTYTRRGLVLGRAESAGGLVNTTLAYESSDGAGFGVELETPTRGLVRRIVRTADVGYPTADLEVASCRVDGLGTDGPTDPTQLLFDGVNFRPVSWWRPLGQPETPELPQLVVQQSGDGMDAYAAAVLSDLTELEARGLTVPSPDGREQWLLLWYAPVVNDGWPSTVHRPAETLTTAEPLPGTTVHRSRCETAIISVCGTEVLGPENTVLASSASLSLWSGAYGLHGVGSLHGSPVGTLVVTTPSTLVTTYIEYDLTGLVSGTVGGMSGIRINATTGHVAHCGSAGLVSAYTDGTPDGSYTGTACRGVAAFVDARSDDCAATETDSPTTSVHIGVMDLAVVILGELPRNRNPDEPVSRS
jgi:hypothetical protein